MIAAGTRVVCVRTPPERLRTTFGIVQDRSQDDARLSGDLVKVVMPNGLIRWFREDDLRAA